MSYNLNELVTLSSGKPTTTTLKIAEYFGKQHKDVLDKIKTMEVSQEFGERNFTPTSYKDVQGKIRPMYEMTKDGFVFLTMGFTGAKAAEFKETYIKAFNEMETFIRGKSEFELNPLSDIPRLLQLSLDEINLKNKIIAEQAPKVAFAERHLDAEGLYDMATTAQLISTKFGEKIGRNNIHKWLEEIKVVYRDNNQKKKVYQYFIDNDYFVVKTHVIAQTNHVNTQIFATPKGLQWIYKKWVTNEEPKNVINFDF